MDREALADLMPPGVALSDPALFARYASDLTGRFSAAPCLVLRPRDVAEVAACLDRCHRHRIAVVPQGGNTGLVGGAIPYGDAVVLTLERLDAVSDVDVRTRSIVAGAGVTLVRLHEAARRNGSMFPLDFAARDSATVGGMIATDAGGPFTARYGSMRSLIVSLQCVLADGTVIDHLDRPSKDGAGFDVTRLLPGSEGTLAVVTAARLKLFEPPAARCVALVGVASLADAVGLVRHLCVGLPSLEAADFFMHEGLELVMEHARLRRPFSRRHGAYVVLQAGGSAGVAEELGGALGARDEPGDVAVATSGSEARGLWAYREMHNAAIAAAGIPRKLDVAVAPEQVPHLVTSIRGWLASERRGATVLCYGHLAAGNVHVNILGLRAGDEEADERVLTLVAEMGGSISAEHGIGRAKARWLHLARSRSEITTMRTLKRALDPHRILNPGCLFPADEDADTRDEGSGTSG